MSFINTKEPLVVGGKYQYQGDRITDFGEKEITDVELVKDKSTKDRWIFIFKDLEDNKNFKVDMLKGNFYYPGMPRIWDEDEY